MTRVWPIAWRELRSHRQALLVAAIMGSFPLLATRLRGVGPGVRNEVAQGLVVALTVVLAMAFGARLVAPDLASGRLAFYWTRPVAVGALMTGRVIGALAALFTAQLLAIAPTAILDSRALDPVTTKAGPLLAAAALFLFSLAVVVSMLVRLRSPVLALDAVAAVVWMVTLAEATRRWQLSRFVQGVSSNDVQLVFTGAGAAVALAWLLIVSVAIDRGRSDGRRVHAHVSLGAWPVAIGAAALLVAAPMRFLTARPDASWRLQEFAALGGDGWVSLGACRAKGNFCTGVVAHPATGRFRSTSPYDDGRWRLSLHPAARAARAVDVSVTDDWTPILRGPRNPTRDYTITGVDLDRPERAFPRIAIPRNRHAYPLLVSPDGTRAATVSSGGTWVAELETGQDHELPAPAKAGLTGRPVFVTTSLLRAFVKDGDAISIRELNIDDGLRAASREVGRFPAGDFDVSTDGARIVVLRDGHVSTHDGRTGALETDLDVPGATAAASLPGGAIVVAWPAEGRIWIARAVNGQLEPAIDAGAAVAAEKVRFGSVQPASDEVHLTLAHADRTVVVDLKTRTARDLPKTVKPVMFERRFSPVVAAATDDVRGHLFVDLGATSRMIMGSSLRGGTWLRRTPGTLTLTPLWP